MSITNDSKIFDNFIKKSVEFMCKDEETMKLLEKIRLDRLRSDGKKNEHI